MDLVDEYRRNARECQRMAENAGNAADKASWLRLAASWLGMIRNDTRRFFGAANDDDTQRNDRLENENRPAWPRPSKEDSKASH